MGAFCSSQSHPPHPHSHDPTHAHPLPERLPLTFSPPLVKRSSRTNQVPSLFDLCLEELCNSLCEPEKEEDVPSPPISSPTSSLPSFVSYGMSRAIWPSLLGATFLRTSVPPVRCRALSLSARHSPEMGPSSNPHPHIPRSTLTFHHRHLHLPEPIIQVIFDYMLSERLLTLSHCTLFTRAHLSTISLGSYPGVTDDWLHLLLASVPYQTCSDTQQILTSPGRIKRQMSATRRAQPSARVSWQGQGESEDEKGLPMSVMRALTTRASIIPTTSSSTSTSAATSPRTPLLSPTQPVSAASVSTRTISPPIRIAQLCGDTSPVPIGLSQSPPQQESMPTLTCLSPVSSPTSTSSDSSLGDSSPTSPVLSSSDSSSASSPLSLSPFNLTSTRRISQLPSPLVTHSLTHLDVSKCQALTEYALRPLVACPLLKYLNVEGCTQLSDTLFTFILRDKYDLTYLNLAGLKGVTNATLQVLSDKDGMKTLILDQCTITDTGLRDLNDFHNLGHLSLGWCGQHVTHDGLHWLCNNSSLTYLNIAFTGVTDASCFADAHHLTYLNVAGTKLNETHWKIPHQFPTLTHLDLQRSRLIKIPTGVLHYGLQLLDVSFTSMSAPKLAYQIASLARMKPIKVPSIDLDVDIDARLTLADDTVIPLHTLRMESCSVDNAVAKSIALCTNLTELNLCDTDITNDGVKCLTSLTNLTHLSLSGCQLTNTALIVFETLTNLKVLYLDCPTITDGGLHYLRHLHSLELLDLFETHITDMGLDHLHSLRALQHLEICSGKLTNVGLNKIAQRLVNLTSLNLSQNPGITDAGVSVLSYLPSLRHINLSGTSITHKGLTFIQSLPLLAHVSLFGCKVKPMSNKIKELPRGVQLGVDEGIVAIE